MSFHTNIPPVNGHYVVDVGSQLGQIDLKIVTSKAPTAGSVIISAVTYTGNSYVMTREGIDLATLADGPISLGEYGHFKAFVVQVVGIAGEDLTPLELWVCESLSSGPTEVFTGQRAMTVQSFTEANVKRGLQFYARASGIVAANTSWMLGVRVGPQPVVVKARECYSNAETLMVQVYKECEFIDGAPMRVENYNDLTPVGSTTEILTGIVPTDEGVTWGGQERLWGDGKVGQHLAPWAPGVERVLAPGRIYIVEIRNLGATVCEVDYGLTWFEGWPDLPMG